jgi:hypothetical protein
VRLLHHVEHAVDPVLEVLFGDRTETIRALTERLAVEQLHHHEGGAVVGLVDVEDLDGAGVAELRDGERLLFEARPQLLGAGGGS